MTKRKKTRRKPTRRRPTRRKTKRKTKRKPKPKPFGGYSIVFTGREETLEEIFGKKPITPPQMTKLIWKFVKRYRLARKR